MDLEPKTIYCAIVMPTVMLVVAILGPQLWSRGRERLEALPGFAIGAAVMLAMGCMLENFKLSPAAGYGWHWIYWIAAGAAGIALLEIALPKKQAVIIGLCVALTILAAIRLAYPRITNPNTGWTSAEVIQRCGLLVVAVIAAGLSAWWIDRRRGAAPAAWGIGIAAMATPAVIGLSGHWVTMSQLSIAAASCGGALAAMSLLLPRLRVGVSTWFAMALVAMAMTAASMEKWYASLDWLDGVLVLAAPLGMWAALLVKKRWLATILAIIASSAIVTIPVMHAVQTFIQSREEGLL